MRRLVIFDTSIGSNNLGDYIIMEYCNKALYEIFDDVFISNIPTHDKLGRHAMDTCGRADYIFCCGTNLLHSKMNKWKQWHISLKETYKINSVTLMGVGWWQYESTSINTYTKHLLNRLLDKKSLHSVRDNYTRDKLMQAGITNVINTACPSMWNLTENHCEIIPKAKAKRVVFTLTDYKKNPERDKRLVEILLQRYQDVYMWRQAYDDEEYLKTLLPNSDIKFVASGIEAFDKICQPGETDYVGTRLHAGIRALNRGCRTIIVSVDNRAKEIAKDTNLPTINREEIERLGECIENKFTTEIRLPVENINRWKSQWGYYLKC